jgi:hypothetical protein
MRARAGKGQHGLAANAFAGPSDGYNGLPQFHISLLSLCA